MLSRILIAIFGATAITIGLLFFMNDISNRFVLRDPTQYFAISDYFRAPDLGRQLPDIQVIPEAAPNRPQAEIIEEESFSAELLPLTPQMEGIMPSEGQPLIEEPGGN